MGKNKQIELKMLDNNIEILKEKMINICKYNNAWEMPRSYYDIQRDFNKLRAERNKLLEEIKNENADNTI